MAKVRDIEDQSETDAGKVNEPGTIKIFSNTECRIFES